MLYSLIRPLLFAADPEDAHDFAMGGLAWLSERPALCRAVRECIVRPSSDPLSLMGLTFDHRIGLAGGFDKNAVAPLAWWALGFGFIEIGTVTPRPQAGHARPRMFRLPRERALVNRMGFNNDGAKVVAERLARQAAAGWRPPIPIAASVGKNATTPLERADEDYFAAAAALAPHVDFITMNVSSPNTPGLRVLQDSARLGTLINAVRRAAPRKPVLVKLAPELEDDELASLVECCMAAGAAGIIATNTLSSAARPDLPTGGLSGRPLRELSRRRVGAVRRAAGDRAVVIGCGGVDDVNSAEAMRDAGADLVQLYTGLVYQGPLLAARLSRQMGS